MFAGSREAKISGGIFNGIARDQVNIRGNQINYSTEPLQFLWKLISDVGARHDSETRYPPPRCHEGTREDILKPLLDWIHDDSSSDRIVWLYGPADSGKSAIAQTIAETAQKENILAASFFFSRGDPKRNNTLFIFLSLAYQLAHSIPGIREPLVHAIRSDPYILQASLEDQLEKLILEPCKLLPPSHDHPKTLVVDGIDECGDVPSQQRVLWFFATALPEGTPFRILLSSRPEPHIRKFFDSDTFRPFHRYLRRVALDDIFDPGPEIAAFLKGEFEETRINPPRGRTDMKWVQRWIRPKLKKKSLKFDPDYKSVPSEVGRRFGIGAKAVGMTCEMPKVCQNISSFLMDVLRDLPHLKSFEDVLMELSRFMASLDLTSSLVESRGYRLCLLQISTEFTFSPLENRRLRDALRRDEGSIAELLNFAFGSDGNEFKNALLDLQDEDAQSCADLIQDVLDKCTGRADQNEYKYNVLDLLVKLCETGEVLPSSLFIKGIVLLDANPCFGGTFGDIYRTMYKGSEVAIKRMRVFQDDDLQSLTRALCRSAILWRTLKHPFVLPFLGIDSDSFPGLLSLVSPWMANGTILIYLEENGGQDIDLRLFEIAQGLAYLHSRRIVHGNLHGSNILIDADGHACFGLSVFSDVTVSTHSAHHAGAVRWMAPELQHPTRFDFKYSQRTFASDVYSFAYVCVELYTGRPPFADEPTDAAVLSRVMNGERPTRPLKMGDWLWNIVEMCWNQERAERPIMSRVVEIMQSGYSGTALMPLDAAAAR